MNELEKILQLVQEYADKNLLDKSWEPGDWVNYSGPHFTSDEFRAAVEAILGGWLVFGKKGRNLNKRSQFILVKILGC